MPRQEPVVISKTVPERQTRAEREDWLGDGSREKFFFRNLDEEQVARALGWLSIGLALAELAGSFMNKALTLKTGRTHVQHYLRPLLERIENGEIDPSFVITHRMPLEDAPEGYEKFLNKEDECIKVVLKP